MARMAPVRPGRRGDERSAPPPAAAATPDPIPDAGRDAAFVAEHGAEHDFDRPSLTVPNLEVSAGVAALIQRALPSIEHVEVLLHVFRGEAHAVDVDAVTQATGIESRTVARVLEELAAAGLVDRPAAEGAPFARRELPATTRRAVEEIAALYERRPMLLVKAIHERRRPVRLFSDAFRLRPREED